MKVAVLTVLLAGFLLPLSSLAQTAAAHDGLPALKFRHAERKRAGAYFVEYTHYGNEPAFRIRSHHYHAWCNGYLYLTPTSVAYDPALTPGQKDGIYARRGDLLSFTPRFSGYEIALTGKLYKLAFLSDPDEALDSAQPDQRAELMKFIALAFSDFAAAQQQFFTTLAGLRSPAAFESKPLIRVFAPAGAAPDATIDGDAPMQALMGVASAASGIATVVVNGSPAKLQALSREIALFQTDRFALAPGNTDFNVVANAADGNQNSIGFHVVRPEVRILAPAPGSKTRDGKVTIQGTVLGMRDLQQVQMAGKPASLIKRADGGFDFRLPDVPLAVGPNLITGFATRANGDRSTFDVAVVRRAPVQPLTVDAIERALKNAVSAVRIEALVDDQGVDFELTPELEKRLRAQGAPKRLLDAIADAYAPIPPH